jgi:three-Cys-motif partner protein
VNLKRADQGIRAPLEVECLLVFNEADAEASALLKSRADPLIADIRATCPRLHIRASYHNKTFEEVYPTVKELIAQGGYRSVLFNLDQCGYSKVEPGVLRDIMSSTPSAEVFLTFAIQSLLTYLNRADFDLLEARLRPLSVNPANLQIDNALVSNKTWLGTMEKLVFDTFRIAAKFVSPFSIKNPEGWRYWLIHFANNYRARQVYNDVLHASGAQAHFGRSGLNMLAYDASLEGSLYLFEKDDRANARDALMEDIPKMITEYGDIMSVAEFYETAYNSTPAHKDDIHKVMIENGELEVLTPLGKARRKANTINVNDTIRLKSQRSLFPIFFDSSIQKKK